MSAITKSERWAGRSAPSMHGAVRKRLDHIVAGIETSKIKLLARSWGKLFSSSP